MRMTSATFVNVDGCFSDGKLSIYVGADEVCSKGVWISSGQEFGSQFNQR